MTIRDISQVLHAGMPVWPGEPGFELERTATIGAECPVNVGVMRTLLHAGTHADSPLHYAEGAAASADCDLDPYVGPCRVIDATDAGDLVTEEHIDWSALAGVRRVLLRTFERFDADPWERGFAAIDPAVIARLAGLGVVLIGVDTPSLDPATSKTMDAHHQVLAAHMRILEGLVLDGVPPGDYELIALPLKIAGADASPVRAILRDLA